MEEFIVLNQKPNIVYAYPKFISKWGANYFSVNRINMIKKIKKSNIEYDLLSNRVEIQNIRRIPKEKSSELYIGLADVNTQTGELTENNTINEGITGISNAVRKGQILFSKLRPNLNKVTICPQSINEALASTEFCIFEARNIDKYYLFAVLKSNVGLFQVIDITTGSTLPRLDTEDILNILIPIPSPEIQKYIGDKVRKAEELREEAKRLKKEAETFLYEMIQLKPLNDFDKDMFSFVNSNYIDSERLDSEYYKTKYITLEKLLKSKKVTSFKDIIIESKYGASVPADYTMVGIPFIRGNNLTDNEINIDDIVYLNKKLKDEVKDHHVNTGDILITRSGTVGISAVVDEKCDGFSFGSFMIKLRIDMRIWNPYYIAAFLNSFWGKWQIERLQNGAVQQNINLQEIGRIIIPIISKENQDKIEELIKNYVNKKRLSKQLIQEAKQDVEDLIEGNFDMSKVRADS